MNIVCYILCKRLNVVLLKDIWQCEMHVHLKLFVIIIHIPQTLSPHPFKHLSKNLIYWSFSAIVKFTFSTPALPPDDMIIEKKIYTKPPKFSDMRKRGKTMEQ